LNKTFEIKVGMYKDYIKTQDEALCHLFLHFCLKDGVFSKAEMEDVSKKFVALGLHADLNFKEEVIKYNSYKAETSDEVTYLQYLIKLIHPVNELALYSYCFELVLSDTILEDQEEKLLEKIASIMEIETSEQQTIKKLMLQRKVVQTHKII
jgi:uncharacterized tellurite resistance protein B-like protein